MGMVQEIVSILVDAQAQGMGGVVRTVFLGEGLPIISSSAFWNAFPFVHTSNHKRQGNNACVPCICILAKLESIFSQLCSILLTLLVYP